MALIRVDKTIYARDEFGVRYQALVEGQFVEQEVYDAAVKGETEPKKTSVSVPEVAQPSEPSMEPEAVEKPEVVVETAEETPEVEKSAEDTADTKPAKVKTKAKEGK